MIFNITTLLCWYISWLNQTCLILTTTLLWTHIYENSITRNEKILQGEKAGVLLFMNSVHIIMCNISRSYLNGLIIVIIFFQWMFMYYIQNSHVKWNNNYFNYFCEQHGWSSCQRSGLLFFFFFFEKAIYTAVKDQ